jgi:hypothetical protein
VCDSSKYGSDEEEAVQVVRDVAEGAIVSQERVVKHQSK